MKGKVKKFIRRYFGRSINVFTVGGWSFHGEVVPALCTNDVIVLLENGSIMSDISFDKIVGVSEVKSQVPTVLAPTESVAAPMATSRFVQAVPVRDKPGADGKSNRPTMDELVEKYKESPEVLNTYGSIIPSDMLLKDDDEEDEPNVDFGISFHKAFEHGDDK